MNQDSTEQKFQLEIPVVLPGVDDARDGCVSRLQERLGAQTGITLAHLEQQNGRDVLCLHYDPNLVPLEKLERLARDEGAAITGRFKHENLPIRGMDCASCAASIEAIVRKMPGVGSAGVSYPTQKMKVEYDSTLTSREKIIKTVGKLGYRVPLGTSLPMASPLPNENHQGHDHSGHHHAAPKNQNVGNEHEGHDHDLPEDASWLARNAELAQSLACGALLVLGFVGQQFLKLPFAFALPIYLS